jgi:cobaltochelatase CobS
MGVLFDPAACGTKITQRLDVAVWDAPDAPPVDDGYVWPAKITGQLLTQIDRGHPVMLTGPAGTGKTSWAEQVAARLKRPYVRIQCNRTTDAAELVGMTVPAGGDKGTRWQDGQLTAAVRRPGTLIAVEEPSVCRPGALLAFQSLMDGGRALHIAETGEVVPLADGVCFVWADNTAGSGDENGAYAGTQQLNRSTIDRLGVVVLFDYMPRDNEVRAVVSRTGCSTALAGKAVDFAARTRADTSAGRLTHGVGIRRLIALAELITDGVPVHDAFEAAIYRGASPDDRESLRQIWAASVVASEWEKAAHG